MFQVQNLEVIKESEINSDKKNLQENFCRF